MKHLGTGSFLFTIVFGKINHSPLNLVSDVIRGSIPIPIAKVRTSQRARSGSNHSLGYDKAHCEPSDWVKSNQWVCAKALRFLRINIKSMV